MVFRMMSGHLFLLFWDMLLKSKNEDASQPVQLQASIIRKQSEKLRSLIADLNLTSRLEYSMQPLIKPVFLLWKLPAK